MSARRVLPLLAAVFALALTGCSSMKISRSKARFYEPAGSYTDSVARSAYMEERIKDLTATGMSREAAAGRASREWFARAPVATTQPTAYELERRAAQADLESYLTEQASAKR